MRIEEKESVSLVINWLKSEGYNAESSDKGGKSSFLHYDILAERNSLNRYIEVKKRRFAVYEFLKYSKLGFIYENTKYQYLKDKLGYYINVITLDGIDYIFNWYVGINTKLQFNWLSKSCKATTDFNNTEYIDKLVSMVYPKDAQIIKCKDGIYTPITYEQLENDLQNGNN